MVSVGLLFLSPPPLTSRPSVLPHSPFVEKIVVGSQRGAMVDKMHFFGYATHGSATALTACTFCGAPLPHCGQARAPEFTL